MPKQNIEGIPLKGLITHQENYSSKLIYMREAQREIYKLYANVPPLKKIHVTPMQFNFFL